MAGVHPPPHHTLATGHTHPNDVNEWRLDGLGEDVSGGKRGHEEERGSALTGDQRLSEVGGFHLSISNVADRSLSALRRQGHDQASRAGLVREV